jgi:hypothetical protein
VECVFPGVEPLVGVEKADEGFLNQIFCIFARGELCQSDTEQTLPNSLMVLLDKSTNM